MSENEKMSDDGEVEPMDGWSIVRRRRKDDVGSDADSVEVISEDSDRETCDEGKDDKDSVEGDDKTSDEDKTAAASPDTTTPEVDTDGGSSDQSDDLKNNLADLDPLGDLTSSLSDNQSNLSREELLLRYVIIASALLALICSLLLSSYLLCIKLDHVMVDSGNDHVSTHTRQELDQVVSKLQKVLHLENEQHLREILSKMPAGSLTLERLIPMADHLPRRIPDNAVSNSEVDGKAGVSSEYAIEEGTHKRHSLGVDSLANVGKPNSKAPKENSDHMKNRHISDLKTTLPEQLKHEAETKSVAENILHSENPQKPSFPQSTNPNAPHSAANHDRNTSQSDRNDSSSNDQTPHMNNILLSVRQDVLAIQKDIYSQIMNSLLEYKIDLYKNLLRTGLDISCPDRSSNKANHKNFMLIRSLQQMIAKSSESNFESWYKFYSYSVFPKIHDIVGKIDSIRKGPKEAEFEAQPQKGKESSGVGNSKVKNFNDDFFIRAGDPLVEPAATAETVSEGGFDWGNLDMKIRETMRNALKPGRPTNTDGKRRGDEGKQRNFVERGQDFVNDKDKPAKNNLKGDFRKRKVHEHKKLRHQVKPQNHNGEHEPHQSDFEWDNKHERKVYKGKQERDKRNYKREGPGYEKGKHTHDMHRNDEKNYKKGKHDEHDKKHGKHENDEKNYKKGKHDEHDKKHDKHENDEKNYKKGKHDEHDKKHDKRKNDEKNYKKVKHDEHDEKHDKQGHNKYEKSKNHEEYKRNPKHDHDEQSFVDDYLKNHDQDYKKADVQDRERENNFKRKQDRFDHNKENKGQYKDKKYRRKISYSDVGKYVKNTVSGLWKKVKDGYKSVEDYGNSYVKDWRKKPKETGKYEEWRKEFVKEMKDVMRVLGGNPTLASLSEVPKSVSKFFGDGLGSIMGSFSDEVEEKSEMGPEGLRPGPEGVKEEMCFADEECDVSGDEEKEGNSDEGYESDYKSDAGYSDAPNHRGTEPAGQNTGSWYYDAANHRAQVRQHPRYPRISDSSWFLGLGRHRAYLRRRGIHLDDDGSWFISSAKHRAKMRQKHTESPHSPYFYSQASSKR